MVPLGELADINPRTTSLNGDEAVSFVGMAELDDRAGVAVPRETRAFSEVAKGYTVFNDGDILAAKITPCWENGKIGVAQLDHPIGVGSTEFHVVRARPAIDKRYLLHFLRQDSVRGAGELRMTGSGGQRRVPRQFLESLAVPVPEMSEQRRIAAILDQAHALRSAGASIVLNAASIEEEMFRLRFGRRATTQVLSDVANISSGITKGRTPRGATRSVPYLAVANVQAGYFKLDGVKTIEATEAEIARFALARGDLLLTEGGDPDKLGRGAVWKDELPDVIHQNHIFRVRIHQTGRVSPALLAAYARSASARAYFLRAAKQTTGIASINKTQLSHLPIPAFTETDSRVFDEMSREIEQRRHEAQRQLASLDALFASLQSRVFLGEL